MSRRTALTMEQKIEYKLLDFKIWVAGEMRRNKETQDDIGKLLGLSQSRISQMLKIPDKNEKVTADPFTYGQVVRLCDHFGADSAKREELLTL